jgi:YVTN family beta-propeller protein
VHDPPHQVVGTVGQHPTNVAAVADVLQRRSGTASVIDTAAGKRIADIAVGELPWGVVVR